MTKLRQSSGITGEHYTPPNHAVNLSLHQRHSGDIRVFRSYHVFGSIKVGSVCLLSPKSRKPVGASVGFRYQKGGSVSVSNSGSNKKFLNFEPPKGTAQSAEPNEFPTTASLMSSLEPKIVVNAKDLDICVGRQPPRC